MKKIVLGIALMIFALSFAQKKDINAQLEATNKAAMSAYETKNYAAAAPKFLEVYELLKTNGQDNKLYKYYAGLSYALANNTDESIKIYTDLIDSGYTGVETTYTAKENKTGQVSNYDKTTWDLLKSKQAKDYSDFKVEKTPGVEVDLYETLSTILVNAKKNDEALAIIEKGLVKFPNSTKLKENQGVALYASGNTDKFLLNLKEQLSKNPKDAVNWYNLGVLQAKNPATVNDAIASFQKALEIDPKMSNAHQNLVYTTIGNDASIVEQINATRKTNPDKATELIETRKERFTKALPYAENWYKAEPTNIDAVSTLKEIYIITKNQAKASEMKAKEAELSAKAK